jgi:hypothetical protein
MLQMAWLLGCMAWRQPQQQQKQVQAAMWT